MWKYVNKDGNPDKEGRYDVILIYEETEKVITGEFVSDYDLIPPGKKLAVRDTRYFGDADKIKGWIMSGQPEEGLVWSERDESYYGEKVWAWLPEQDIPEAELPDGVEWE